MASKLKPTNQQVIDANDITLLFPNDKPYPWRREHDITIDPNDKEGKFYDYYDERILDAVPSETVASIRTYGIGEPVILIEREGVVLKVDGLQRIKARRLANDEAQKAGEPTGNVPYIVNKEKDAGAISALRVMLNTHRSDDDMLTKARLAEKLIARHNWTPAQAAMFFKVSGTAIKNWLAMLDKCTPAVLKAVERGKIAATTALNYAKHDAETQEQMLAEDLALIEGRTQVRGGKEKRLSGSEVGKARTKAEPSGEEKREKAITKAVSLLQEMSEEDRLQVFKFFDCTTGEEAPLANLQDAIVPEDEEDNESDEKDLTIVYDDEKVESENQPTVVRRKRATKTKK